MKQNKPTSAFRKTIDNFFYHYKFHFIGGILALIIISWMSFSFINQQIEKKTEANLPPAAIDIILFGDYKVGIEEAILEDKFQETFPAWERIKLEIEYAPHDTGSYEDIAAMQRSIAVLHTVEPDIYIFDQHQYDKFIDDGSFIKLDDYFTEKDTFVTYKKAADENEHVYGIDITDSHLFSELEINNTPKIALINAKTEKLENAVEFIEKALHKK